MMHPQKPCSEVDFKKSKIQDNERSKADPNIVIIAGEDDIYENETPPNSTVDMNEKNTCPPFIEVGNKTYTKMRVPNWYVEGYKIINVENAICLMDRWVKRSNSNGGETSREEVKQVQGSKCDQGEISINSCDATFPKPISVKPNCSGGIKSKFQDTAACQNLPSRCDQTSKALLTVQTPKEILAKPHRCVPMTFMLETCTCSPPKDNNPQLVKKQLKTKKDRKTKSSANSKEFKVPPDGKTNKIFGNCKTSKQTKSKCFKIKASPTNDNSMVSQCSQTSPDPDPNELYRQQYNNDPNQSSIAEITAYRGKSSIKRRCDPSIVEHLLITLFGSQFSDIDGIEIKKIRKDDSSCIMDNDQSKVTVESCNCQTELQDGRNDVAYFCNMSKEVTQNSNTYHDEEERSPQCSATHAVHQDFNSVGEADDCHAQVFCSESYVMQRPQEYLYTNEQFEQPLNYQVYGRCANCGRNKISQNQEYN